MRPLLAPSPFAFSKVWGERYRAKLWSTLVERVIEAVNQRGMCAAELGKLAELPTTEIESLGRRCRCKACFEKRAN